MEYDDGIILPVEIQQEIGALAINALLLSSPPAPTLPLGTPEYVKENARLIAKQRHLVDQADAFYPLIQAGGAIEEGARRHPVWTQMATDIGWEFIGGPGLDLTPTEASRLVEQGLAFLEATHSRILL
jgi:hypothetical protein